MKTVEEIKDNRAREEGYKDWKDLEWNASENCVASLIDELMREYSDEWHKAFRELSVSHVSQGKEIHELKNKISELNGYLEDRHKYIEELQNTLGLRNRSNPDLTIDPETDWESLFDRWRECKD